MQRFFLFLQEFCLARDGSEDEQQDSNEVLEKGIYRMPRCKQACILFALRRWADAGINTAQEITGSEKPKQNGIKNDKS